MCIHVLQRKKRCSYLFPSLPVDWLGITAAVVAAGATFAVVPAAVPPGWLLFAVLFEGAVAVSPLWAESSESYSSSLLLDDVRK